MADPSTPTDEEQIEPSTGQPVTQWAADPVERRQQVVAKTQQAAKASFDQQHPFLPAGWQDPAPASALRDTAARADQEFSYQQQQARQQAVTAKRAQIEGVKQANSVDEAKYRGSGQQFYTDPATGRLAPVIDSETGRPLYHPSAWEEGVHPQTGEPTLQMRDKYGQRQFKAPPVVADPDPLSGKLLYNLPSGAKEMGNAEDLIGHANPRVAKLARATLARQRVAQMHEALAPAAELNNQTQQEYKGAQEKLGQMQDRLDQLQQPFGENPDAVFGQTTGGILGFGGKPTPEAAEAITLRDQIKAQSAEVGKGGKLWRKAQMSNIALGKARLQAEHDAHGQVASDREEYLRQTGATDEQVAADPIYQNALAEQAKRAGTITNAANVLAAHRNALGGTPATQPAPDQVSPAPAPKESQADLAKDIGIPGERTPEQKAKREALLQKIGLGKDDRNKPLIGFGDNKGTFGTVPSAPQFPDDSPIRGSMAAVANVLGKAATGLVTPTNLGIMALAGGSGKVVQRLISGGFGATMLKHAYSQTPEAWKLLHDPKATAQQKLEAIGDIAINVGLGVAGGVHAAKGGLGGGETAPEAPPTAPPSDQSDVAAFNDKLNKIPGGPSDALKTKMADRLAPKPFTPTGAPSTAAESAATIEPALAEAAHRPPPAKSAADSAQVFAKDAQDSRTAGVAEEGAQRLVDQVQQASGKSRDEILATRKNADGTSKPIEQWADELQKEAEYQKSPLTVDPERRAGELRGEISKLGEEWKRHTDQVSAEAEQYRQLANKPDEAAALVQAARDRHDDITGRREAIEQQLTEADRLRQSPEGGEKLKADLAEQASAPTEPLSDHAQYQDVQAKLSDAIKAGDTDKIQELWRQNEEIKNRNDGMPPEPPKPIEDKPNATDTRPQPESDQPQHPRASQGAAVSENKPEPRPEGGAETGGGDRAVGGPEGKTENAGAVRETVKLSKKEAAPVSADVAPHDAESVEGKKIDKKWTAFDKDSGTLGIPREEMPQIKSEARGALVNFLQARGIKAKAGMIDPSKLKPTQAEFSPEKVQKAREHTGPERPLLISSDGHVIDGHHQWVAALDDPHTPMKVIRLDAPVDKLLSEMKEFPSVEQAKGAAPVTKGEEATKPATKRLSDRAIEALQKAKKGIDPTKLGSNAGLIDAAHDAALDVAILAIRAGRAVADVVKLAVTRFKAKYPDATPDDIANLTKVVQDAHEQVHGAAKEGASEPTKTGEPSTTGIAHRVSEARGIEAERGEGISPEESITHGRQLLKDGYDLDKEFTAFDKTKAVSADLIAAARAKVEELSKASNKAADEHGTDSPEYKAAWNEEKAMIDKVKPLQTEWHKQGQAQQGETEIDTGTFHGLQRAFRESTGKDMTPKQAEDAKRLAGDVKGATDAAEKAQKKVLDSVDTGPKTSTDSIDKAVAVVTSRKPGSPWTPEHAKALWHLAKADYLDQGKTDFNDIRAGLATDLGLTKDEVAEGLAAPKGVRALTDEMYAKMAERRRVVNLAKQWVAEQKYPGYEKFFRAIPGAFFNLATFGHGTVWTVTHAGNQYFLPKASGQLFRDLGRSFKLMGIHELLRGEKPGGYHERMMQDLVRDPNYITAKRAGLANDPFKYQDDYQNAGVVKLFKQIGLMGNRGFDGMKLFRQFRFNQEWESMPSSLKTPEAAKLLADNLNKATGITKASKLPAWTNTAFFAPKLELSRWAFLYGDPVRDVKTLLNHKNAKPEEVHNAVRDLRQKATMAGVYFGALALNQAVLSATGSSQQVNITNPRASDWLSFKGFGHNIGVVSPMINSVRFLQNIAHDFWGERTKLEQIQGTRGGEAVTRAGEYLRGKLSPFAGVALDAASQSDAVGRPMPWSNDPLSYRAKQMGAKDRYGYGEYASKKLLPIPFEEAATDIWKSQGAGEDQVQRWLRAIAIGVTAGTTGARITPQLPAYTGRPKANNPYAPAPTH